MCTNQDISNIPFIIRGNHFLVHGHKTDIPHITCIFHLLKFLICSQFILVSAILHHISLLRLLSKSYFKITFQPNFLCSSSFKIVVLIFPNAGWLDRGQDVPHRLCAHQSSRSPLSPGGKSLKAYIINYTTVNMISVNKNINRFRAVFGKQKYK